MLVNPEKMLATFKNPVCNVYLKNGEKKIGCDIGVVTDPNRRLIIEDGTIIFYPVDVIEKIEIYDKGE